MTEYRQVSSFESPSPAAVATGDEAVAFGQGDQVTLVTGADRTTVDHGDRIEDIALADRLLVLSAGTLTAYSLDGNRVWNHDAEDACAVAGLADHDFCGVLTAEALRYVDTDSGRERRAVERPRRGTQDDTFLATSTGFIVATWSFLTAVDLDGEIAFDRDLSAVVRSVGACTGTVVAALQSDRLVGLDEATGDDRWQTELEARQVSDRGTDSILVSTADGVLTVESDGKTAPAPDLATGDVYATTDGSVVCTVRDGTIATYVPDRDRVGLAVRTETVGVGGTIDVEATNPTETPRTATLAIDAAGCSFSPDTRSVTIESESSVVTDFPVAEVTKEGDQAITITVDEGTTHSETVSVEDAVSGGLAVEPELSPQAIEDGTATIAVTVENIGGVPLDAVRLLESGVEATDIDPGETWEETVTRLYEPDRRVSVGLEVVRGDRRREYAPTCTLPPSPTVAANADGEALRATVDVADDIVVTDRLVVEMPGAGRVRSPVTIDGTELLLVVPQYGSGVARIALDAIDAEARVNVAGTGTLTGASSSRPDRSEGISTGLGRSNAKQRTNRSRDRTDERTTAAKSDTDTASGTGDSTPTTAEANDSPAETGSSSAGHADAVDTESTTKTPVRSSTTPGNDQQEADAPPVESAVSATRQAPSQTPGVGRAVRERLVIENTGRPVDVTIRGDESFEVGRVGTDETVSVERFIASGTGSALVLPAFEVTVNDTVVDEIAETTLPVDDSDISVSATIDPTDGGVHAEVSNQTQARVRVTGVDPGPNGGRSSLSATALPGETTTVPSSVAEPPGAGSVVPLSFWVQPSDDTERRLDVLAVVEQTEDTQTDGSAVSASISPDTQVAGDYSSVVLAFENDGTDSLSSFSVVADGEPIDTMFYSPARREVLGPGDRVEHFVDLESGLDAPEFSATVSYEVAGSTCEYTLNVSGPAVDDESAWTDEHRKAWSLERAESPSPSTAATSHETIATPFRSDS